MKFISFFVVAAVVVCVACNKNNDHDNMTVNATDTWFVQQASYSNYDEISAGSVAAANGSTDSVRAFGSMMVSDHGTAQASLDSLALNLNVLKPTGPDSAHLAIVAQLQTLSGHIFDTTYIGAQIRDHMTAIQIFQTELSNGNNQQIKNYASMYLPVIQAHLQEAENIQQQIQ